MVWGFCVYFVYMIPLETDVLRNHRFQKQNETCALSHTVKLVLSGHSQKDLKMIF